MKSIITFLLSLGVVYGLFAITNAPSALLASPPEYAGHPSAPAYTPMVQPSIAMAYTSAAKPLPPTARPDTLTEVSIDGVALAPNKVVEYQYALACGDTQLAVAVNFTIPANYTCNYPSGTFTLDVTEPGMHTDTVRITRNTTGQTTKYAVKVYKPYPTGHDPLMVNKANLVLIANNNPATNGGYSLESYTWYQNGQYLAAGQNYYASKRGDTILNMDAEYTLRAMTSKDEVLTTCPIVLAHTAPTLGVYPNPVSHDDPITIYLGTPGDINPQAKVHMYIELYTLDGVVLQTQHVYSHQCSIQAPARPRVYLVRISALDRNYVNISRIMVK